MLSTSILRLTLIASRSLSIVALADRGWTLMRVAKVRQYERVLAALVLAVVAFVVVATAWAGMTGRLTRNWFVGIRTRATLASDEAWRAGHRAGGPWIIGAGASLFVGSVGVAATGPESWRGHSVLLITVATSVVLAIVAAMQADRAARRAS